MSAADSTLLIFSQYLWVISYSPSDESFSQEQHGHSSLCLGACSVLNFELWKIAPKVLLMICWGTESDVSIWPQQEGKDIFHSRHAGCLDRCASYLLKPFDSRLEGRQSKGGYTHRQGKWNGADRFWTNKSPCRQRIALNWNVKSSPSFQYLGLVDSMFYFWHKTSYCQTQRHRFL